MSIIFKGAGSIILKGQKEFDIGEIERFWIGLFDIRFNIVRELMRLLRKRRCVLHNEGERF